MRARLVRSTFPSPRLNAHPHDEVGRILHRGLQLLECQLAQPNVRFAPKLVG